MGVSKASLRGLPIDQRIERMQAANKPKTLRVTPVNDTIRMILTHPNAGGFPKEGSVEWPDDGFTHRRVQDGDITVEKDEHHEHAEGEHVEGEEHHGEEHHGRRHRTASSKGESSGGAT